MDYNDWFSERLSDLRIKKGVSARDMSLSLGQSESYINKIENKRTLPSMNGFFIICDYLGITPKDFFDMGVSSPDQVQNITLAAQKLTGKQAEIILQLMNEIIKE